MIVLAKNAAPYFQARCSLLAAVLVLGFGGPAVAAQMDTALHDPANPQMVLLDTDIGDDIDDAFAVGLALASPEVKVVGISAAWGDTELRARLLDRLLQETGRSDIPVAAGPPKHKTGEGAFSQARWAERAPKRTHADAATMILNTVRQYPGAVTLIGLGPMTNLAEAFNRDPETFRRIKRIVVMGGSVRSGYLPNGSLGPAPPGPEYNIAMDPEAAQRVLASGVPFYVMPLDSTQLKLDEVKRQILFTRSTPLTDALTLLYEQWSAETGQQTPTMFDAVAVAYAIEPELCPATPLRIAFDADGRTREEKGKPNSWVCLHSSPDAFFRFYLQWISEQRLGMAAEPLR